MKSVLTLCLLGTLATLSLPAAATPANPAIEAAVSELGRLNGSALACKQPALVSRARNAVQTTAPKTRSYGEVFENATNDAFLAQGKAVCPDSQTLASRIAEAETRLTESVRNAK